MPQLLEPLPSSFVAQFRLVAEREESFLAAHGRGSLRLFDQRRSAHERRLPHLRRSGEHAVVADVAAEVGQGEEDLLRIADEMSMARVAKLAGHINQSLQVRLSCKLGRFFRAHSMSFPDSPEETAHHHRPCLRQQG